MSMDTLMDIHGYGPCILHGPVVHMHPGPYPRNCDLTSIRYQSEFDSPGKTSISIFRLIPLRSAVDSCSGGFNTNDCNENGGYLW